MPVKHKEHWKTRQKREREEAAAAKAKSAHKPASKMKKPDDPDKKPTDSVIIKGTENKDTRLYQTSPDDREWLTKEEATAKGFYWRDED